MNGYVIQRRSSTWADSNRPPSSMVSAFLATPHLFVSKTAIRRRQIPRACAAYEKKEDVDHAVSVAPASLDSLPFPGETITLSLGTTQLRLLTPASLRNEPPRALLYLPSSEATGVRAGALLAVSAAQPNGISNATIEATSVCRARIDYSNTEDEIKRVIRLHDWSIWEYGMRIELAHAMCRAVNVAEATRRLRRQLGVTDDDVTWTRVRATRADQYDTDLLEHEWEKTPRFVRETWCKRAELFSFAAIRYAGDLLLSHPKRAQVWDATDTLQRVYVACELLEAAKAEAVAKLSLKNALGGSAR